MQVGYSRDELITIKKAKVLKKSVAHVSLILQREIPADVFDALTIEKIDMLLHNYSENTVFLPYYSRGK